MRDAVARVIATALGVGRMPRAPGTFGSLVGLAIGAAPWWPASLVVRAAILVAALLIGVAASTATERASGAIDPGYIVIDEVVAMAAIVALRFRGDLTPLWLLLAFALFRLFDIAKPPPLRHLAKLPAGWGVMMDDVGAAVYAGAILFAVDRWIPQ